jgi:DNA-binding CsgD family transcriptional regulator
MCRNEWCLAWTLGLIRGLLESIEAGQSPPDALCLGLARGLHATAAAYIRFNTRSGECVITPQPASLPVTRLKAIVERAPRAYSLLLHHLQTDFIPSSLAKCTSRGRTEGSTALLLLREVLDCRDIAQIPLSRNSPELRLVALVRPSHFDDRDNHLMKIVHRPLATLDALLQPVADPGLARGRAVNLHLDLPAGAVAYGLTMRELQVLELLETGMLARTIAARMGVSHRTVHKHLGSIYRKLDAHDRLAAVDRAREAGIIPNPEAYRHRSALASGTSAHGAPTWPFPTVGRKFA